MRSQFGIKNMDGGPERTPSSGAFEGTRAVLIHPEDADGATVLRELRRCGCMALGVWPPPQRIPEGIDVLFFYLDPKISYLLAPVGDPIPVPVVGIAERNDSDLLWLLHDCAPLAVIQKPIAPESIAPNLYLARQIHQYQSRLLKRIGKLDETLKSIRNVERAKAILMKSKKFSEHEAYHFMRRQAMEKRIPIGTIATTIIDAKEILG